MLKMILNLSKFYTVRQESISYKALKKYGRGGAYYIYRDWKPSHNDPWFLSNFNYQRFIDDREFRVFISKTVFKLPVNYALANSHCDLKVSLSQAKIYENFANYFLKP